jgi:hypothetical protein
MRTPNILCSEDSLGHLNGLGRRAAQHFGGFLHQMKGRQKVDRKKGFYTSRLPKNERIRGNFVLSSKEF